MPSTPDDLSSAARAVQQLATSLYGPEWAPQVSRLTGLALRTVQRVKAGCDQRLPDRKTAIVLEKLRQSVLSSLAFPTPSEATLSGALEGVNPWDDAAEKYGSVDTFGSLADKAHYAQAIHAPLIALDPRGLIRLLDRLAVIESGFIKVLPAAARAVSHPEDPSARIAFADAALNAGASLDGLFAVDENGQFVVVSEPVSVFGGSIYDDGAVLVMPLEDGDDHQLAMTVARALFPLAETTLYRGVTGWAEAGGTEPSPGLVVRFSERELDYDQLDERANALVVGFAERTRKAGGIVFFGITPGNDLGFAVCAKLPA